MVKREYQIQLVNYFLSLLNILHYLRCSCENCVIMQSQIECICCREVVAVLNKLSEANDDIKCITEHPGLSAVCLNVWVLQAAYLQYRQQYGNYNPTFNESVNYYYCVTLNPKIGFIIYSIPRQIQPLNPKIGFNVNPIQRRIKPLNPQIGYQINSIQGQNRPFNPQIGFNINSIQRRIQPLTPQKGFKFNFIQRWIQPSTNRI